MRTQSITLTLVGMAFALGACNPADKDRTTSVPRGVDPVATVQAPPTGLSAPPAQPDYSPPSPNATAAAPGTNASQALAENPTLKDPAAPKMAGDSAEAQRLAVEAQTAAVRAPDTASGDAAKKEIMERAGKSTPGSGETAKDTEANQPRIGHVDEAGGVDGNAQGWAGEQPFEHRAGER